MAARSRIEGLSLLFAAGTAAGALFTTGISLHAHCLAAGLSLAFLGGGALLGLRRDMGRFPWEILFALAGWSVALTAAFPGETGRPVGMLPARAADALKGCIDAVPYPSAGTAPLVRALLTGDRSGLSPTTVAAFRTSGAAHLLALSGFHIGILYLLFSRLTAVFGRSPAARLARSLSVTVLAAFYTLMTGASPSIVRAFLFILIGEAAALAGRPRDPARTLCLALTLQLTLDPAAVGSPGFQLSYLAMAGIVLVHPHLRALYPADAPFKRTWDAASLAISCQLFTGPLSYRLFHAFPRHFLLTNLLALPLTTVLVALSLITLVLSALHGCPPLLIRLNDAAAGLLVRVLETVGTM